MERPQTKRTMPASTPMRSVRRAQRQEARQSTTRLRRSGLARDAWSPRSIQKRAPRSHAKYTASGRTKTVRVVVVARPLPGERRQDPRITTEGLPPKHTQSPITRRGGITSSSGRAACRAAARPASPVPMSSIDAGSGIAAGPAAFVLANQKPASLVDHARRRSRVPAPAESCEPRISPWLLISSGDRRRTAREYRAPTNRRTLGKAEAVERI